MNVSIAVLTLALVSYVACRFSTWNSWSACSVECGVGISSRERVAKRSCGHSEIIQRKSCKGKCQRGYLLSKGKSVTASSTFLPTYKTSRVVDGNRNNDFYVGKSCFMSEKNTRPWIMVDLNAKMFVSEVVVYNRGDCCQSRLNNLMVTVGNNKDGMKNPLCGERRDMQGVDVTRMLCFRRMNGRYVLVTIPGPQYLTVCELEVYGTKLKYIALDLKSATARTINSPSLVPLKAIDGNVKTFYAGKKSNYNWLKVDLGKMAMVKEVILMSWEAKGSSTRGSKISVWKSGSSGRAECGVLKIGKGKVMTVKLKKFYVYKVLCHKLLKGRYIRVERKGWNKWLEIREVKVFGYYL